MPEFNAFALWNEADWIAAIATVILAAFLAGGLAVGMSRKPEFAGHPCGLYMLFFAEMWERFSYYGMRAILIFYLTQHWLFSDSKSTLIYGAYTSLVYITPVLGGYLADRYLGQRKAVLFGGVLLVAAGLVATLLPGWRAREETRRTAWSTARAAIDSAAVSRDAAATRVPEAEQLLARAELIAGGRGGPVAARAAAEFARRADLLWRAQQ